MDIKSCKKTKIGIILGIAVVAVIAAVVILLLVFNTSSEKPISPEIAQNNIEDLAQNDLPGADTYEDAVEIYYDAINEKDFEKMLKVSPGPINLSEEQFQFFESEFKVQFEGTSSWSYRITGICEISVEKFDGYKQKINEKFEKEFGKTVEIDDGFEVCLEINYKDGDGEDISSENEIFAYKSGGRWFLTAPYVPEAIGG